MDDLLEKVRKCGFERLEDFVEANLHYLPAEKQKLFQYLTRTPYKKDGYHG